MGKPFYSLPNVADVLLDWFQPLVFTKVVKSVVNFENVERPVIFSFMGVVQPLSPQQLRLKPEGQRKWPWFMVHATVELVLTPDDIISFDRVQYRVMEKMDYTSYGYVEYHLVKDYVGSGPYT